MSLGRSSIGSRAKGQAVELSINKAVVETLVSGVRIFDVPMDPKAEGEKVTARQHFFG